MKRLLPRSLLLLSVCSLAALGQACDSATPTAPSGTILTISAIPSQIAINGTSQITVIGRRPDGNPLNPGTEIFFSTSIGSITPTVVAVDDDGVATATLRGDGRSGTANVTASVSTSSGGGGGGGEEGEGGGPTTGIGSATVTVQVGQVAEDRPQLILSASPNTLFVNENAEITIIARNADGSPVGAGQTVILTTTLGSVSPQRPVTGSDGVATSTYTAGTQPGTVTVTAILGASEPATTDLTIQDRPTRITLQSNRASIPNTGGEIDLIAVVTNAQAQGLGQRPVEFTVSHGTLSAGPVVLTNSQGLAENTLTVDDTEVNSGDEVVITVSTAGAEGENLTARVTVDVQ